MPEEKTDAQKLEELQVEKTELEAQLKKTQEDVAKAQERYDNADKKIKEQGAELGELRKVKEQVTEFESTKVDLQSKIDALEEKIKGQGGQEDDPNAGNAETVEQIEARLSEEARKRVEKSFFEEMTTEERIKFDDEKDDTFRKIVLKRAMEIAPLVPTSPWRTPVNGNPPGAPTRLDQLFGIKRQQGAHTPDGPGSMGAHATGAAPDEPVVIEDDRVH